VLISVFYVNISNYV